MNELLIFFIGIQATIQVHYSAARVLRISTIILYHLHAMGGSQYHLEISVANIDINLCSYQNQYIDCRSDKYKIYIHRKSVIHKGLHLFVPGCVCAPDNIINS